MITIKEIASKAGVSPGTVDRVLHNRGRVSKESAERVRLVAREAGYVPNLFAKRLKEGRSLVFGVLIPDIDTDYGYWKQVVDGIEEARREIEALDATIVYSFFHAGDTNSFIVAAEELFRNPISAYIVAPLVADGMERVVLSHRDVPYAFIDSSCPSLSPMWDFSQDPIAAGLTGARLMKLFAPSSAVFVLKTGRGAYNEEMRALSFCRAFGDIAPSIPLKELSSDGNDMLSLISGMELGESGSFGVFITNDQASVVASALSELSLLDRACIIGFDLSEDNKACLEDGRIGAVIGQRPRTQGHDAVMAMYNHFMFQKAPESGNLSAPVDIYIRENIPESTHWL